MGVVNAQTLYRTDGGRVMPVSSMSSTHLMNALNHHRIQLDTVKKMGQSIRDEGDQQNLQKWILHLNTTIAVLEQEFITRDPDSENTIEVMEDDDCRQWDRSY